MTGVLWCLLSGVSLYWFTWSLSILVCRKMPFMFECLVALITLKYPITRYFFPQVILKILNGPKYYSALLAL